MFWPLVPISWYFTQALLFQLTSSVVKTIVCAIEDVSIVLRPSEDGIATGYFIIGLAVSAETGINCSSACGDSNWITPIMANSLAVGIDAPIVDMLFGIRRG